MSPQDRDIVYYPHPALRRTAEPITEIDDELVEIAGRMIELMHRDRGVGLAGPQVALGKRIFVMCPSSERGAETVALNPAITSRRGKASDVEGCLSLPDITGKIERAEAIGMTYFDLDGEEVTVELEGFPARVAQHELDHLEGVLITDRMRPAERASIERRLRDLIRAREEELQDAEPANDASCTV